MRPGLFTCVRQFGYTLVELMVVLILIGIMATTAVVVMTTEPSSEDIARRLSGLIGEASRLAIAGGPTEDGTARTRVVITGLAGDQVATIERYDDGPAAWQEVSSYDVAETIEVVGFRVQAELDPGAIPDHVLANGDYVSLACYPDGSCVPDNPVGVALTIYLREIRRPDREARVVILPLGGAPLVYDSW
jgi:prepilin-type N-terminal cleavage/methylation domain-containing protein